MATIYSCEEHIGHALDMFVAVEKEFPIMDKVETEQHTCEYCENKAEYIVANK